MVTLTLSYKPNSGKSCGPDDYKVKNSTWIQLPKKEPNGLSLV